MREKVIEKYLKDEVKKLGGLSYKWSSPAQRGVMDRIVFLYGKIYFIEVKNETGKLSRLQEIMHDELRARGCNVLTVHSKEEVDEFLTSNKCF